jgi:hypothetical protein
MFAHHPCATGLPHSALPVMDNSHESATILGMHQMQLSHRNRREGKCSGMTFALTFEMAMLLHEP